MNVLDENIIDSQRQMLLDRGIAVRQVGVELGHRGMSDQEILPLLHGLSRPTFFTRDQDFYDRRLCHHAYCLVFLDVDDEQVAESVAPTLRHRELKTWAQRLGTVIRISPQSVHVGRLHAEREAELSW